MQLIPNKILKRYQIAKRWIKNPREQLLNVVKYQIDQELTLRPVVRSHIDYNPTIPADKFVHKSVKHFETATGNYYLPMDADYDCIIQCMKEGKIFEPEIVVEAKKFISPGSTVLDVGANFGQMSYLFSKMTGPNGQVLAFEADSFIFHLLQKNIAANHSENIRAFFGAVYDGSLDVVFYPTITLKRYPTYGSHGIEFSGNDNYKVETFAIDDLQIKTPIGFMKVDIQGSDLFALRGAVNTIKEHQMPIIFEYEEEFQEKFNTSFQDYMDFIQDISYKVVKTINQINYLIMPKNQKNFTVTANIIDNLQKKQTLCLSKPFFQNNFCKLLQSKAEIEKATNFLHRNGFISHFTECKNWDLAHIISEIGDGNFLDMGNSGSYILKNLALKKISGEKYGIDFSQPDEKITGVDYFIGDLMDTGLPESHFKNISCLSVLEHQVDFNKFAFEVSRLLLPGGKLFVTFDYWEPKIVSPIKLFDLQWQPFDKQMVLELIEICQKNNLYLVQDFDFTLGDPVIEWGYYSPHPKMAYTFAMAVFEKKI